MKPKAVLITMAGIGGIDRVYSRESRAGLEDTLEFTEPIFKQDDLFFQVNERKDVNYFFSTWGMPALTKEQISGFFPNLKAVFYAAGSVQHFARPFLEKGIRVFSAADANAVPVIDFTAAQIFLANKGYFQAAKMYHSGNLAEARNFSANVPGNYGIAVGIIGAGKIGRGVIEKLKPGRLKINVFDPFLKQEDAVRLGVNKVETLDELFETSFVISNHLANNEKTRGMIQYRHFAKMHDYGVFINTARGAQVDEEGLVRAFREKPTRTALLDVTWPEPVQPGHEFFNMDNVFISPHQAGAKNNECLWLGEFITDEYLRFIRGEPTRSEVTGDMLATMA